MNAKEIRQMDISESKLGSNPCAEIQVVISREIAAQLAEQNEKLDILLHPPIAFNVDIGPNERMGFPDKLPQPIFMAMEPRKTLRDQFAMAALSIVATYELKNKENMDLTARDAYKMADALMEARK